MFDVHNFGGYRSHFIKLFLANYNIDYVSITNLENTSKLFFELSLEKINLIILYTETHILSFLKINDKWCFYDNENNGRIIDLSKAKKAKKIKNFTRLIHLFEALTYVGSWYSKLKNYITSIDVIKTTNKWVKPKFDIKSKSSESLTNFEIFLKPLKKLETYDDKKLTKISLKYFENPDLCKVYKINKQDMILQLKPLYDNLNNTDYKDEKVKYEIKFSDLSKIFNNNKAQIMI